MELTLSAVYVVLLIAAFARSSTRPGHNSEGGCWLLPATISAIEVPIDNPPAWYELMCNIAPSRKRRCEAGREGGLACFATLYFVLLSKFR